MDCLSCFQDASSSSSEGTMSEDDDISSSSSSTASSKRPVEVSSDSSDDDDDGSWGTSNSGTSNFDATTGEELSDMGPFNLLQDDELLRRVFQYIPGNYRYIAVNKRFSRVYRRQHSAKTTYLNAMASLSTAAVYQQEGKRGHVFLAAKYGTVDIIQYFRQHERPWNEVKRQVSPCVGHKVRPWENIECQAEDFHDELQAAVGAIEGGNLQNLKFLCYSAGIKIDYRHGCVACHHGQCGILEWLGKLPKYSYAWTLHIKSAIRGGQVHVLQWIWRTIEMGIEMDEIMSSDYCALAARKGHLCILQFLRANDCPWGKDCCKMAALHATYHDDLRVLEWVRTQDPPCPWGDDFVGSIARYAGMYDNIKVLQWLRAQNPPVPWNEEFCNEAACQGKLTLLQWLRAQDPPCPWSENSFKEAISAANDIFGSLEVLKWMRAQDPPCPWDEGCCKKAVEEASSMFGNIEALQWLRAQDPPCPWDEGCCKKAVEEASSMFGNIEALQWLRAQDPPCPWNAECCLQAAADGNLLVLKWLRAQSPPCPWDKVLCSRKAAVYGHSHITKWIKDPLSSSNEA